MGGPSPDFLNCDLLSNTMRLHADTKPHEDHLNPHIKFSPLYLLLMENKKAMS